jgi:iron-sulfur cluster repair protein YtfE (RIC family)
MILTALVATVGLAMPSAQTAKLGIPPGLKAEHEAIHKTLVAATKAPGKVGEAAQNLALVLHPHFIREEEIALPPLGLLRPLSKGARPADRAAVLRMIDKLRKEMPRMIAEHVKIRKAVQQFRRVAVGAKAAAWVRLADDLAAHATSEEEVMYPAALLVGDFLRQRR